MPKQQKFLNLAFIETPIGTLAALADDTLLYLLQFKDTECIVDNVQKLLNIVQADIIHKHNSITQIVQKELDAYFKGELKRFSIPFGLFGNHFQQSAWNSLIQIPYGHTISYTEQARMSGAPKAHRAVATANANNRLAIILPCHRVILRSGQRGGYNGGVHRKEYLLDLEKRYF